MLRELVAERTEVGDEFASPNLIAAEMRFSRGDECVKWHVAGAASSRSS
jgi:hypothetical protein